MKRISNLHRNFKKVFTNNFRPISDDQVVMIVLAVLFSFEFAWVTFFAWSMYVHYCYLYGLYCVYLASVPPPEPEQPSVRSRKHVNIESASGSSGSRKSSGDSD